MMIPSEKKADHPTAAGYSLTPSKKVMLCSISVARRASSPNTPLVCRSTSSKGTSTATPASSALPILLLAFAVRLQHRERTFDIKIKSHEQHLGHDQHYQLSRDYKDRSRTDMTGRLQTISRDKSIGRTCDAITMLYPPSSADRLQITGRE